MLAGEAVIFASRYFTNIAFLWHNVIGCGLVVLTGVLISNHQRPSEVGFYGALAVLVRYEQCLMMQEQLRKLENTIELLTNGEEVAGLIEGLRALEHGRTRSIKAIRASLQKKTIPAGPSVHPSRKGVQRKGDTLLDRCTAGVIHRQVRHRHSPTLPTADGRRRSAGTFSKLPL